MKKQQITEDEWQRYLANECTKEEAERVLEFLTSEGNEDLEKQWFEKQLNQPVEETGNTYAATLNKGWKNIHAQINKTHKPAIRRLTPFWIGVAAACIGLLFAFTYLFLQNDTNKGENISALTTDNSEVLPGGNKATLKLSDGSVIELESAVTGSIARQGNTSIIKLNSGQLAYNSSNEKPGELLYNTLVTPTGGQYNIMLPDGSRVWLNAGSSLRFPAAFIGEERRVELTGEGYFEVMPLTLKGAQKTLFIVQVNNMDVKVLGTHFNISAYSNEASVKTTLLEGSVNVITGSESRILKPGQQAQFGRNGNLKIVMDANAEQAIAWKNGNFKFIKDDIETIMRQLERWYNVNTIYEGKKPTDVFSGEISRQTNISNVLKMLELSGVRFKTEGRNINVLQ